MKYKFQWISLIVVIGLFLPSFLQPAYLKEGADSNVLYYEIFTPIFLVWLIWAVWRILILVKNKIFPTAEKRSRDANYREFNRTVYADEITLGKILISSLKFIWGAVILLLKIPTLLIVAIFSLASGSSSKQNAVKIKPYMDNNNQNAWGFDGHILRPYMDNNNQNAWEFDGHILKPCMDNNNQNAWKIDGCVIKPYMDNNNQNAWEFDGRILKPYMDNNNQNAWELDECVIRPCMDNNNQNAWEIDSVVPILVVAKAAGII